MIWQRLEFFINNSLIRTAFVPRGFCFIFVILQPVLVSITQVLLLSLMHITFCSVFIVPCPGCIPYSNDPVRVCRCRAPACSSWGWRRSTTLSGGGGGARAAPAGAWRRTCRARCPAGPASGCAWSTTRPTSTPRRPAPSGTSPPLCSGTTRSTWPTTESRDSSTPSGSPSTLPGR